jgi:AhpD family alkylhydroperoxidase
VLNVYLAFSDALGKGVLTATQREIVALALPQANECHYRLSAHTLIGKGAGLSSEGIRKAREGKAETAIDGAVASFARRVVETRGQVTDADIAAARSAGLDDARIIEVIANVAINVLTNYTNNGALTISTFRRSISRCDLLPDPDERGALSPGAAARELRGPSWTMADDRRAR